MINEITTLIAKLGIDPSEVSENTLIGDEGIGFDSQELVELTCMIEKKFRMKLPNHFLNREYTVGDIARLVQNLKSEPVLKSPFQGKSEASIFMNCPPEQAYLAIYEMEKWPENLPHVERIETLYNDGVYQEFLMDVLSDTGLIKVRSIRRCMENDAITFFQPNPPRFLKHHCGGWKFEKEGEGCKVTTWHQWNPHPERASEIFPPQGDLTTDERIEKVLKSHAELALETWKGILEGRQ